MKYADYKTWADKYFGSVPFKAIEGSGYVDIEITMEDESNPWEGFAEGRFEDAENALLFLGEFRGWDQEIARIDIRYCYIESEEIIETFNFVSQAEQFVKECATGRILELA